MSRILVQAKALVKGDVLLIGDEPQVVRANLPHPRIEDHVLILLAGKEQLERESGELVRIRPRVRPIY
jgi:hypothetical protein